jgi:hypothetical protein
MQEINTHLVAVSWAKRAKNVGELLTVSASYLSVHVTSHDYFIVLHVFGYDREEYGVEVDRRSVVWVMH